MSPFPFDFERQTGGSPGEVGAKSVHSLILQFSLVRGPHLESEARKENSQPGAKRSFRLELVDSAQRRKIGSVIHDVPIIGYQRASQHEAIAVPAGRPDSVHDRSILKLITPDDA